MSQVNFILCLHNHQPVGNFDNVFEAAYRQSYEPFFAVADRFPEIKLCIHYSGSLLEWLERAHPKFITKLKDQVSKGRLELLGGGYYEPILTMLPDRDKIGQITLFSDYLEKRFGKRPRGIWLAERVWEQSLVKPLAEAGIEYTVVDDFHFKTTGFNEKQLDGYYVTEDQGKTINIFPIPEVLRYAIPFKPPLETISYLLGRRDNPHPVIAYADDGEKFGIWPKTYQHCYDDKWLENFFYTLRDAVTNGRLNITTFSNVIDNLKPEGKAYLPDCSYREMTEWALPTDVAIAYEDIIKHTPKSNLVTIRPGGYWRNFKVKYPEINLMYSKMVEVSGQIGQLPPDTATDARKELYRGQGNCAYWHGVFGGFYLPHLRHAMYQHLIEAEKITSKHHISNIETSDFDYDGFDEVKISDKEINCYIKPACGGTIYEYDIINKGFNPLATLSRRREAYHHKILEAQAQNSVNTVATIHDLVVSKTAGLENLLYYDNYLRQSLVDHFLPQSLDLDNFTRCNYSEDGDFVGTEYKFKVNKTEKSLTLWREGVIKKESKLIPIRVEKTVSFTGKDQLSLEIKYTITNQGSEPAPALFACEFNLSMLAGNAFDRYYYDSSRHNIGPLITAGKAEHQELFGIKDEYQKIDIALQLDNPTDFWFFPVQTVSQSEGGFELIYQSSVIMPLWRIQLEPGKKWTTRIIKKVKFL
ncbi:MAG: alpha-amylase/4-alpha-glucanotransferase domain-containing protein [Candidatus Brocadiia bacterium]